MTTNTEFTKDLRSLLCAYTDFYSNGGSAEPQEVFDKFLGVKEGAFVAKWGPFVTVSELELRQAESDDVDDDVLFDARRDRGRALAASAGDAGAVPATLPAEIPRELLGTIVDEVFDGAIEDASVIEDIYRVIARHATPSAPTAGERQSPQVGAAPADEQGWRELFWSVARALGCLPSTSVHLNGHVYRRAEQLAAAPEVAAPQAVGWLKFDPMSPPPDGLYWAMVSEPETDCDVDDYGRTIGWHTGETIRRVAMLHFDGVDDDGPNFAEVNDWELGKWNGECRVTHLLPVAIPTAPDADRAAQAASPVAPEVAAPQSAGGKICLNGFQLRNALEFLAPDGTNDQLEEDVCIQYGPARTHDEGTDAAGAFCWLFDYPDEGSIRLDDEADDRAAQAACTGGDHAAA